MSVGTIHKINQLIHIIILLKGDTPTKWSLWPNNNYCVLISSLFIVKYLTQFHQQDNMHSTTICKGVMFLLFIQFSFYNNSQMYNSNHFHSVNHQNRPLPHLTSIIKYTQKSCFKIAMKLYCYCNQACHLKCMIFAKHT